ncbi:transcriptional regulator [Pseudomonas viridiflava]|uniref:transcriptional regulator n=1 Tax=Pseudomonas viridiflava TaxID=33069 RepID=UPI000F026E39|nr:transcriptional regulator [Pseudomonas viridiflava]
MSLRIAYGSALKFLRARQDSSQENLGHAIDRSYISRLERGERSVTVDVSHSLAEALQVDPLTLLVLAYAAERSQTPQQVVDHLLGDLTSNGLMESRIPSLPHKASHPVKVAAEKLRVRIRELMAAGLSQAEVARRLGVARQTVSNHLKKMD